MDVQCEKCRGDCKSIQVPVLIEKNTNLFSKFFRLFFIGMGTTNGSRVEKVKKNHVWVCNQCGHTFPDNSDTVEDATDKEVTHED